MKRITGALTAGAIICCTQVGAQSSVALAASHRPFVVASHQSRDTVPGVLVMPTAGDSTDSIRTILQRDLELGGALSPVTVPATTLARLTSSARVVLDLTALREYGARYVVESRRRRGALAVAVHDLEEGATVASDTFPVPDVPPRVRADVRDSVMRFYAAADSYTRARIRAIGITSDSLARAVRAANWALRGREPSERDVTAAAWRQLLLDALAREDSTMRAWVARAPAERDSLLTAAARRDAALHDSLAYVERMWLHSVADEIQLWLTGTRGIAASRVAYVSNGRLFVMDSDGANVRMYTNSGRALSPAWHPSGRWIVFTELGDGGTQLAEVDVTTGSIEYFRATPRGFNLTPVYTPDGRRIVFAAAAGLGNQLVSLERGSLTTQPLGRFPREASGPTFNPAGTRLAYVAPRPYSGTGERARTRPAIFVSNVNGTGVTQLTPTAATAAIGRTGPEWSPDGQYIAYTQQERGFHVWIMRLRDREARRVSDASGGEDPTWAPDSRHIAYSLTRGSAKDLWILDIASGRTRQLTRNGDARLPAWSPRWIPPERVVAEGSSSR